MAGRRLLTPKIWRCICCGSEIVYAVTPYDRLGWAHLIWEAITPQPWEPWRPYYCTSNRTSRALPPYAPLGYLDQHWAYQ